MPQKQLIALQLHKRTGYGPERQYFLSRALCSEDPHALYQDVRAMRKYLEFAFSVASPRASSALYTYCISLNLPCPFILSMPSQLRTVGFVVGCSLLGKTMLGEY